MSLGSSFRAETFSVTSGTSISSNFSTFLGDDGSWGSGLASSGLATYIGYSTGLSTGYPAGTSTGFFISADTSKGLASATPAGTSTGFTSTGGFTSAPAAGGSGTCSTGFWTESYTSSGSLSFYCINFFSVVLIFSTSLSSLKSTDCCTLCLLCDDDPFNMPYLLLAALGISSLTT